MTNTDLTNKNNNGNNYNSRRIRELYERYTNATATREELAEFFAFSVDPANEPVFEDLMSGSWDELVEKGNELQRLKEAPIRRLRPRRLVKWSAAVSVILILAFGSYYLFNKKISKTEQPPATVKINDVAPGGSKAVLILANGSQIILDSANNGLLAKQSGSSIVKTDSGKLIYNKSKEKPNDNTVVLNTLATPRGGQYQLTLPDGTGVWLNSASSITYPATFVGKERRVTITGEVYFEVVHNDKQPFCVTVNGILVQDIGTDFNINSYGDEESIRTTLLEGAVKVISGPYNKVLKPGQQAGVTKKGIHLNENVDLDQVVAWKEGFFQFDHNDLQAILRQLSRWYNIQVEYQGNIPDRKFFGRLNRNLPLSSVLTILRANNIHYTIESNNRLVIQP